MAKSETHKDKQIQKFADKARELGCDENETAFEDKLRRVAKAKPTPRPTKKARGK